MTAADITIRLSRVGSDYWLRPASRPLSVEAAHDQLSSRLLDDGPADDVVLVHFVSDAGLDGVFAGHEPAAMSIGWEGVILPHQQRRTVRLPAGVSVTPDATDPGLEALLALRPYAPWILQSLASPHLDLRESLVIRSADAVVGWVPVWRPAPTSSVIRLVVLAPQVHAGEERRRTHLQLAAYARTIELQCTRGRTVVSWLPDDGDPVNALKLSVAAPAQVRHWMSIRVRRDLGGAFAPEVGLS